MTDLGDPGAPTDAALVAAACGGDDHAFAALLRRYRDDYTRFAVRMLGDMADADEALQSAFLRAYRNIRACAEPHRFGAWLYRIVVNECRTYATRRARRERRLVRDVTVIERTPVAMVETDSALRAEIHRALAQIPTEQREAFVLKHVEELSYEEMADITGVGVSALKMRVKRGCERLRELLTEVHHA